MQQYYIVFYSHVNYSVTKIMQCSWQLKYSFYSHVNYSVTKIVGQCYYYLLQFYSHVNYSVTKIILVSLLLLKRFTVT